MHLVGLRFLSCWFMIFRWESSIIFLTSSEWKVSKVDCFWAKMRNLSSARIISLLLFHKTTLMTWVTRSSKSMQKQTFKSNTISNTRKSTLLHTNYGWKYENNLKLKRVLLVDSTPLTYFNDDHRHNSPIFTKLDV